MSQSTPPAGQVDDAHWVDDGWAVIPESIEQLLAFPVRLAQIGAHTGGYVWRGQANVSWKIRSSLQRTVRDQSDRGNPVELKQAERSLIDQARDWGLGTLSATHVPDLQLLAQMQHHGVPTRLIDVSQDAFTALWFACSGKDEQNKDGILFAVDATYRKETHERPHGNLGELADPLSNGLEWALTMPDTHPVVLTPTIRDERMTAQQGAFLVGMPPDGAPVNLPYRSVTDCEAFGLHARPCDLEAVLTARHVPNLPSPPEFAAVLIRADWKPYLLQILQTLGKSRRTLYPDLAGFAQAIKDDLVPLDPAAIVPL